MTIFHIYNHYLHTCYGQIAGICTGLSSLCTIIFQIYVAADLPQARKIQQSSITFHVSLMFDQFIQSTIKDDTFGFGKPFITKSLD
jgi:hypothetical protein